MKATSFVKYVFLKNDQIRHIPTWGSAYFLGASHAVQLKEWDPSAPNFGPYVRPCRLSESDRILHLRKRHSLTVVHPQLNGQDTCFPKFLEPPTYSPVVWHGTNFVRWSINVRDNFYRSVTPPRGRHRSHNFCDSSRYRLTVRMLTRAICLR